MLQATLPVEPGIPWERIALLAIGAALGVAIREVWALWKERRARRARLRVLLQVARDEVQFYLQKLQQLAQEIGQFLQATQQGGTQRFTPSYTLYPEFLEHQRRLLAEHSLAKQDVVRDLGHCAFELRHITKRLADARTLQGGVLATQDWTGTHGLVAANIATFQNMLMLLQERT